MSIFVPPETEKLILDKVNSGLYHSSDEVIYEAFRLLKERDQYYQNRMEQLRKEIQEGIQSGSSTPLDMEDIIERAEKRWVSNQ